MHSDPAAHAVGPAPVLLLGDPRLRRVSLPVMDLDDPVFREESALLQATLSAFRKSHDFGRAIAAPQIGVARRFLALELDRGPGHGPRLMINPEVTWKSPELFTMWDDCMSFPSLLVRVRRHRSISVRFLDEGGQAHHWEALDQATSELLQHEIDHLDGILAVDLGLDRDAIIFREVFEAMRPHFQAQVDYVIGM